MRFALDFKVKETAKWSDLHGVLCSETCMLDIRSGLSVRTRSRMFPPVCVGIVISCSMPKLPLRYLEKVVQLDCCYSNSASQYLVD